MHPKLTFDSVVWLPLAVVVSAAAVACGITAYLVLRDGRLSKAGRVALIVLRTVSLLAVVTLLLRPAWLVEQTLEEKLGLILLVDSSQSMTIRDGDGERTRMDAVRALLQATAQVRKRLAEKYAYKQFGFARDLDELDEKSCVAQGRHTAIGDALVRSPARVTVGSVGAIVLISDGTNNHGRDPEGVARELGARGIPIYPVPVGKKEIGEAIKDVKMVRLHMSPVAFTRNKVPIDAMLELVYCRGATVAVSLLVGDKTVETKHIIAQGQDARVPARFMFEPEQAGPVKITVRAKPIPGEIVTTNNEISSYLQVLSGGLNLLYIDRPGGEFKWIKDALVRSKEIGAGGLTAVVTLGHKVARPSTVDEWRRYDAVILGNIPSSVFTASQLGALKRAVSEHGTGLAMIAGTRNFSAGGYGKSVLAGVLPVTTSDARKEGLFEEEYHPVFTPAGAAHFMLRLEEGNETNRKAWAELQPLNGGTTFLGVKPGGIVLAMGPDNRPVLVVGRYGRGRTMALASDSTRRWAFSEKDTRKYHRRFWRQVALWLGGKEDLGRTNVWISLQSLRVVKGESMEIAVHVETATGEPIPDAKVQAKITPPKGPAGSLPSRYGDGRYVAMYRPDQVGDYGIQVKALASDGSLLGQDTAKFITYSPEVELEHPSASPDVLAELAEASGGKVYSLAEAETLFRELAEKDSTIEIKRAEPVPLWSARWLLYVFLAALTLEWIVRKVHRLA